MLDSTVVPLPGKWEGEGLKVRRAVTHLSTKRCLRRQVFARKSREHSLHLRCLSAVDRGADMISVRRAVFPALVCLGTALCGFAQSLSTKPEEQVAQLERDWLAADAKGDVVTLQRIIAPDFIGGSFDGQVLNKEDIIPQDSAPGGFAGSSVGETSVRVFGDTAVLVGSIKPAEAKRADMVHVTLVCQKREAGWQMIAAQLSRVPLEK